MKPRKTAIYSPTPFSIFQSFESKVFDFWIFFFPPSVSRRADEVTDHRGERRTMINGRYFAAGCSVVLAALISPTQNNNTNIGNSCRSDGDLQQTHKGFPGTPHPAADRLLAPGSQLLLDLMA